VEGAEAEEEAAEEEADEAVVEEEVVVPLQLPLRMCCRRHPPRMR